MATEETKVTMPDGVEVVFKGDRKMQKGYTTDGGKVKVRFDFVNGHTINFELPDQLVLQAAGHGVVQKGGDSAAGEKNVEDMILAVQDTLDNLAEGNWRAAREGGGFSGAGVVLRALCKAYNWNLDQGKAWVAKKIEEYGTRGTKISAKKIYDALRESEKVGPIVKELEAAEKKKETGIDSTALLQGLPA